MQIVTQILSRFTILSTKTLCFKPKFIFFWGAGLAPSPSGSGIPSPLGPLGQLSLSSFRGR